MRIFAIHERSPLAVVVTLEEPWRDYPGDGGVGADLRACRRCRRRPAGGRDPPGPPGAPALHVSRRPPAAPFDSGRADRRALAAEAAARGGDEPERAPVQA